MDTKSLRVEIKDADRGEVVAIFSTFDVIDAHDDVTLAGAFEDGAKTRISAYNHSSWQGALPVGAGAIKVSGREAQLHGKFFMHIPQAAATFATVKAMSEEGLQEWSYGYDVAKFSFGEHEGRQVRFLEKMIVHEVSPVLIGAGVDTRTLSAKSADTRFSDEIKAAMDVVACVVDGAERVVALRAEKRKPLSQVNAEALAGLHDQLKRLDALLPGREPDPTQGELQREFLRYLAANR